MAAVQRFLQPPAGWFFLFGPRGTGKSTWQAQVFPAAVRFDLLAPEVLRPCRHGPSACASGSRPFPQPTPW